jgi:hypothetical protein
MSTTTQNPAKISERSLELVRRCRVAAMVFGRGEDFRILFIPDSTPQSEIVALGMDGFRHCGLIGFDGVGVHLEAEDGPDAARILKLAAPDFMLAVLGTGNGGTVN